MPDFELESPKDARLVNAFIRGRNSTDKTDSEQPLLYNNDEPEHQTMVRSKDTVNQVSTSFIETHSAGQLRQDTSK